MFLFFVFACVHATSVTVIGAAPAHYIVFDDAGHAYDCLSEPTAGTWEPTCVRVAYRSNAPHNAAPEAPAP